MSAEKFYQCEDANGVRLSFNTWPCDRIDARSCAVQIGALYTPLKPLGDPANPTPPLPYEPVRCSNCKSVLNCHCTVDYQSKLFFCPSCNSRNPLPPTYQGINQNCLPAELIPGNSTVEYITQGSTLPPPPVFMFVVDSCCSNKEHDALKTVLLSTIATLPQNALVGLITYGSTVQVNELAETDFPRVYLFSGSKTYDTTTLMAKLDIKRTEAGVLNNFIIPITQAESYINNLIDRMAPDNIQVVDSRQAKNMRLQRCTGAALSIAVMVLRAIMGNDGGQIILFTSGPITRGPGQMAESARTEPVRQHSDLEKNKAEKSKAALAFFNALAKEAADANIVINYISACFEESGLYELEPCIHQTGGWLLSGESWKDANIIQTLSKYMTSIIARSGSAVRLEVNCSSQFKVCGLIGPARSNNRQHPSVSEKIIGQGGTNMWRAAGALPSTTYAFYFDVFASRAEPVKEGTRGYMQFETSYRCTLTGETRTRVTTIEVSFADMAHSKEYIINGFDQEAAAVLMARYAMNMLTESNGNRYDTQGYLDKTLIHFSRRFGSYSKNQADTFSLPAQCSSLPMFLYHFRRSPFMNTFNASPDLTTSLRHSLLMEDTTSSLFMIQPTLIQYLANMPPTPVQLDMSSLRPDCMLLLDTFFKVLVWSGATLAQWRNAGYFESPEYEYLKLLTDAPLNEAEQLIAERFPTPLLVTCDQDSSLSRFLLAKCNPSQPTAIKDGEIIEDEPTYAKFYNKLKAASVSE